MFVAFLWIGSPIQWSLCGSIAGLIICMFWLKKQMALLFVFASYVNMWGKPNKKRKTQTILFWRHKVALFVLDFLCSRSFWFSIAHGGRSFYTVQCWRANGVCTRFQQKLLVSKVLFSQAFLRKDFAKISDLWRWWEGLVDKGKIQTSKIPTSLQVEKPDLNMVNCPHQHVELTNDGDPMPNQHFPAIEVPNAMSSNQHSLPASKNDMWSLSKMGSQRIR